MYSDELQSIATAMDVEFKYVLLLQLCYEACACCTSAVTKINNEYAFFRTMDWPMDFLKDLTVNLEFMKNGKLVFIATTWVGYIGVLTATVPTKYSLAVNYRQTKNVSISSVASNIMGLLNMNWPVGYLIRDICEKNLSYKDMLYHLCNAKLVSPCYITVCGTKQHPKIITRDPSGYSSYKDEYVVQTNCDQCKVIPDILYSVDRRNKITEIIVENKNNFKDIKTVIDKFYVSPIKNSETIYYSIMIPQSSTHIAFLS